jgi:hypothetical protein
VHGAKAVGEACTKDIDCDAPAGFTCVRRPDKANGSCQKSEVTQAGRDCSAAQKICAVGFFCDGDNCVEAKDPGDGCTIHEECGAGFCNAAGKCEARHETSASCTADIECADGICYTFENKKTCTDRIILSRSEPLCEELR